MVHIEPNGPMMWPLCGLLQEGDHLGMEAGGAAGNGVKLRDIMEIIVTAAVEKGHLAPLKNIRQKATNMASETGVQMKDPQGLLSGGGKSRTPRMAACGPATLEAVLNALENLSPHGRGSFLQDAFVTGNSTRTASLPFVKEMAVLVGWLRGDADTMAALQVHLGCLQQIAGDRAAETVPNRPRTTAKVVLPDTGGAAALPPKRSAPDSIASESAPGKRQRPQHGSSSSLSRVEETGVGPAADAFGGGDPADVPIRLQQMRARMLAFQQQRRANTSKPAAAAATAEQAVPPAPAPAADVPPPEPEQQQEEEEQQQQQQQQQQEQGEQQEEQEEQQQQQQQEQQEQEQEEEQQQEEEEQQQQEEEQEEATADAAEQAVAAEQAAAAVAAASPSLPAATARASLVASAAAASASALAACAVADAAAGVAASEFSGSFGVDALDDLFDDLFGEDEDGGVDDLFEDGGVDAEADYTLQSHREMQKLVEEYLRAKNADLQGGKATLPDQVLCGHCGRPCAPSSEDTSSACLNCRAHWIGLAEHGETEGSRASMAAVAAAAAGPNKARVNDLLSCLHAGLLFVSPGNLLVALDAFVWILEHHPSRQPVALAFSNPSRTANSSGYGKVSDQMCHLAHAPTDSLSLVSRVALLAP
jgi:flagellar motor protein MotB